MMHHVIDRRGVSISPTTTRPESGSRTKLNQCYTSRIRIDFEKLDVKNPRLARDTHIAKKTVTVNEIHTNKNHAGSWNASMCV